MYELRPYQAEARDAILSEWKKGHRRTLLVLPTGCGKTIAFAAVIQHEIQDGSRALVLAHRGELLTQAADKLKDACGIDSVLEKAEKTSFGSFEPVTVGSVQSLAQQKRLEQYTDIVVLTIFTDVKVVSVYSIHQLIMNALVRTQQVFTRGTEALYGNMWAKKELDKIRVSLGYYEYIMTSFVSIVFSTTLVMILPFVSLYTKGIHDIQYIVPVYAAVIILAQMFYSFRAPYLTLVQGVGHYKQTKKGAYAEAVINLTLSVILVQFIGMVGVAIGTLAANVFRTVQYALYIDKNILPRGKLCFVKRILWALGNTAVVFFVCRIPAERYAYSGWHYWILVSIAVVLFGFAVTLASSAVFYRKDMMNAVKLVMNIFLHKRGRQKQNA